MYGHYNKEQLIQNQDLLKFQDPVRQQEWLEWIFGKDGVQSRLQLLETAQQYQVPIYIITSGSFYEVIRSLQLGNLEYFIKGVYQQSDSPKTYYKNGKLYQVSNPGLTKYDIIDNILKSLDNSIGDSYCGYFIDDNSDWSKDNWKCPKIQFLHIPTHHPQDTPRVSHPDHLGRHLEDWVKHYFGETSKVNLGISNQILERLKHKIKQGKCQILFFDWDNCFQILEAPYPFEYPSFKKKNTRAIPYHLQLKGIIIDYVVNKSINTSP
jgi:hypothetical protein